MAVVFDPTLSGVTANSYLTLAELKQAGENRWGVEAAAFRARTDDDVKRAGIAATMRIDQFTYPGARAVLTQALEFPRTDPYLAGLSAILKRLAANLAIWVGATMTDRLLPGARDQYKSVSGRGGKGVVWRDPSLPLDLADLPPLILRDLVALGAAEAVAWDVAVALAVRAYSSSVPLVATW
jgi:hypothetical protein